MNSLGERIYKNRERLGLSQLELSDLLDVSRQSISKWETDAAVPELSKLVKMAEVFGVTLDELVLGRENVLIAEPESSDAATEIKEEVFTKPARSLVKLIFGAVFLSVGLILGFWLLFCSLYIAALVIFLTFALCSFFCFMQLRHAALWCADTWFAVAALCLYHGNGVLWSRVFDTYTYIPRYTHPLIAVLSWVELALIVVFFLLHVRALRDTHFGFSRKKHTVIAACGVVTVVLQRAASSFWMYFRSFILPTLATNVDIEYSGSEIRNIYILEGSNYNDLQTLSRVIYHCVDLLLLAAFLVCLVPTFCRIRDAIRTKKGR